MKPCSSNHRGFAVIVAFAAAALQGALTLSASAAPPRKTPDAAARQAWQDHVARTPVPQEGCFEAAYPSTIWKSVQCKAAPDRPYLPRNGHRSFTVGDGNDYSAVVDGIVSSAVGSFPSITGLKSETNLGHSNYYSLQINSQFFTTSVCNGATNPSSCLGWQQFVYSNTGIAFMQYWLIDYGNKCPAGGWMSFSGDCYRNSAAVSTPVQALSQLANLKVTGNAVVGGNDTLVFTTSSKAYSTSGKDTVVNLAKSWNAAEWNVIGDGNGSEAKFNKGTSITEKIALTDGLTAAPACVADDGTTAETNNLNLGSCSTSGGSTPSVQFTELR